MHCHYFCHGHWHNYLMQSGKSVRGYWEGSMTLSITTFSIMILSIRGLFGTHSISDSQHKWHCSAIMLSVVMLSVLFYLPQCWMSLCWVSLCWVSWHQWEYQLRLYLWISMIGASLNATLQASFIQKCFFKQDLISISSRKKWNLFQRKKLNLNSQLNYASCWLCSTIIFCSKEWQNQRSLIFLRRD
jgi:hypothetical protein